MKAKQAITNIFHEITNIEKSNDQLNEGIL